MHLFYDGLSQRSPLFLPRCSINLRNVAILLSVDARSSIPRLILKLFLSPLDRLNVLELLIQFALIKAEFLDDLLPDVYLLNTDHQQHSALLW